MQDSRCLTIQGGLNALLPAQDARGLGFSRTKGIDIVAGSPVKEFLCSRPADPHGPEALVFNRVIQIIEMRILVPRSLIVDTCRLGQVAYLEQIAGDETEPEPEVPAGVARQPRAPESGGGSEFG